MCVNSRLQKSQIYRRNLSTVTSRTEMESRGSSQSRGCLGDHQHHHHLLQIRRISLYCLAVIFNCSSVYLDLLRNQSGRKEAMRFH